MATETQVKERPIIFTGEMVRAILDGRKSQTRRVVKPSVKGCTVGVYTGGGEPIEAVNVQEDGDPWADIKCPYGVPGDHLYVKETHYLFGRWIESGLTPTGKIAWEFVRLKDECHYRENPPENVRPYKYRKEGWYRRPSIFMEKRDARILLEITSVRVERLADISEEDARAEGSVESTQIFNDVRVPLGDGVSIENPSFWASASLNFKTLWNSINEKRGFGWDKNPWVWVVEFKEVKR